MVSQSPAERFWPLAGHGRAFSFGVQFPAGVSFTDPCDKFILFFQLAVGFRFVGDPAAFLFVATGCWLSFLWRICAMMKP